MLKNIQGHSRGSIRLCVCRASFLMTFVTSGMSLTGSRHSPKRATKKFIGNKALPGWKRHRQLEITLFWTAYLISEHRAFKTRHVLPTVGQQGILLQVSTSFSLHLIKKEKRKQNVYHLVTTRWSGCLAEGKKGLCLKKNYSFAEPAVMLWTITVSWTFSFWIHSSKTVYYYALPSTLK